MLLQRPCPLGPYCGAPQGPTTGRPSFLPSPAAASRGGVIQVCLPRASRCRLRRRQRKSAGDSGDGIASLLSQTTGEGGGGGATRGASRAGDGGGRRRTERGLLAPLLSQGSCCLTFCFCFHEVEFLNHSASRCHLHRAGHARARQGRAHGSAESVGATACIKLTDSRTHLSGGHGLQRADTLLTLKRVRGALLTPPRIFCDAEGPEGDVRPSPPPPQLDPMHPLFPHPSARACPGGVGGSKLYIVRSLYLPSPPIYALFVRVCTRVHH